MTCSLSLSWSSIRNPRKSRAGGFYCDGYTNRTRKRLVRLALDSESIVASRWAHHHRHGSGSEKFRWRYRSVPPNDEIAERGVWPPTGDIKASKVIRISGLDECVYCWIPSVPENADNDSRSCDQLMDLYARGICIYPEKGIIQTSP